jgi:8-oxo-dGTP diphosphatase
VNTNEPQSLLGPVLHLRTSYVLGFCFNVQLDKVVLIRKRRPEWQRNRLNGVGGKIKENETPLQAMQREFREEADWNGPVEWRQFGILSGPDWEVHLFQAQSTSIIPYNECPEGNVSTHHVHVVLGNVRSRGSRPLPNLRYLIPMAINHATGEDGAPFFHITEGNTP